MPTLLSVQVGRPVAYQAPAPGEGEWHSAIVKRPVAGAVQVGTLGVEGDEQADKRNHGGPYRAINVYPSEHYAGWRQTPGLEGMGGGAFGENFTTQGLLEESACVGDVYRVGAALVTITQPRGPCYKLNRRWQQPDLQQRAEDAGWVGWYLRVLEPGMVEAGAPIQLVERPSAGWTIARVWALHMDASDQESLRALLDVPGLSPGWKESLRKKLE